MNPLQLSPGDFRRLAEKTTALAADYLEAIDQRPCFPATTGGETERLFAQPLPEEGLGAAAFDSFGDVLRHSRAQNGRFFGYVLGSGEPVAALGDLLASVLNQNVTAWRSGPAAVTLERTVVGWLAQAIGCDGFTGSLCGGGSAANLMGLAMAREARAPANARGAQPGVVYVSEEVHMSMGKAVALLGLGRDSVRTIPTDDGFRMVTAKLEAAIAEDYAAGRKPIAVVASAGTVNTGAIDPLAEIGEVAGRFGLWFHVDGAYGALAALAAPQRFAGMARADSISLDAHKWLYQPLDCGCLLYRDAAAARAAFSHSGEYARSLSDDPVEGFSFFEESLELSRRFRALKLWLSLRYHGLAAFRQAIARDLRHAQALAEKIRGERQLELLAPVGLSVACFRFVGKKGAAAAPEEELDRWNAAILKRILERGRVYLSNARLRGKFALRACIVNHRTTEADLDAVVEEVLAAAREVRSHA
jgi:glutamate/tyrosine decarboxylase-like PLP-dependent enzyme